MARPEPVVPLPLPDSATLRSWVEPGPGPRVTVYVPLETGVPDVKRNALFLEQAAAEAARGLAGYELTDETRAQMLARLRAVETDLGRLPAASAGLGVLLDRAAVHAVALPERPPVEAPVVRVGETYSLRPLLAVLGAAGRYRVLAFSINRVALFEGGASGLAETKLEGVPTSLVDALGEETTQKQLQMRQTRRGAAAPAYHAHGSADEERAVDWTRFHEVMANALATHLPDDGVPLVLAATDEHRAALCARGRVPGLVEQAASGNADHLSAAELHARTWPLMQRVREQRGQSSASTFEQARNRGKGVEGLDAVAAAAFAGRVRRLWVDAAASAPGRLDAETGRLAPADGEDAFDAVVERVVALGGEVVPLAAADVPSGSGIAAELY